MLCKDSNVFQTLYDFDHVDKNWFKIVKVKSNYYLFPAEDVPHRTVKSKRFIAKVMLLATVARSRYYTHKRKQFNGKIGIWPFVIHEATKKNSKNREKGKMVTKQIKVTSAVYISMITTQVIPAMKDKSPVGRKSMNIKIQQDNARPHIIGAGTWMAGALQWHVSPPIVQILTSSAGIFNAIHALQHQEARRTINELIEAVQKAFDDMRDEKLDNVFFSLQKTMKCTMKAAGNNEYALAHVGKKITWRRQASRLTDLRPRDN